MKLVVDTSALFAVIDADDEHHAAAVSAARRLANEVEAMTTNYVAVEVLSLVSRRLGMDSARRLLRTTLQPMGLLWTSPVEHAAGGEAFLESGRTLSFVDCLTMSTMRSRSLDTIFTFDDDFRRAGFTVLP